MKITLTGSLGHISKPLAQELVWEGHDVTVISSKADREVAIEELGAKAAIGTMEDAGFLTSVFKGADAVYCMEAPGSFFDPNFDLMEQIRNQGNVFVDAIKRSGVKQVVHLSSIGAHTNKGNGILAFHHEMEQILNTLPEDVAISFMRPVGFYYNLYSFIPLIKSQGIIAANYGDENEPWVSPADIAEVIAEEIVKSFEGRNYRYIASDELNGHEAANILGGAIGKPDLQWVVISDEQQLNALLGIGMNPVIAAGLVEMNAARRNGILYEDYYRHRPKPGKTKMQDFAKEFAAVYHQNN